MTTLAQNATFEQTAIVAFNGASLITAKIKEVIYVAMRPIVEAMGLDWAGQTVKLNKNKERYGSCVIATPSNGGLQEMLCIPLRKLNGWLFSINPEKVRSDLKEAVIQYQEECFEVLYRYWQGETLQRPHITHNPHLALRDTIQAVAKGDRGMYKALYNRLYRKFQVTSYKELNDNQCVEAAEFIKSVQGEYVPRDKIEAPKPTFALADGQHYIVVKDGEPLYRYLLSSEVTDSCLKTMGINQNQFNSLKNDLAHFLKPHDPYLQITYPTAQRALSMMIGLLTILEQHGLKMDEMYQKLDYVKMLLTNYHTRLSEADLHLSIVKRLVSTTTHPTVVSGQGVKFG